MDRQPPRGPHQERKPRAVNNVSPTERTRRMARLLAVVAVRVARDDGTDTSDPNPNKVEDMDQEGAKPAPQGNPTTRSPRERVPDNPAPLRANT